MRRFFVILGVLVVGLGVALAWRLYRQEAEKGGPSGGNGTVEGVEVDVVPRLAARIVAIHVEEGAAVKRGQVVVELDCDELRAARDEVAARLAAANAALVGTTHVARSATEAARGASAQAKGARAQASSAASAADASKRLAGSAAATFEASREAERAAGAQASAAGEERGLASRIADRIRRLHARQVAPETELDTASTRAQALSHQASAAAANVSAAAGRTRSVQESVGAAKAQAAAANAQAEASRAQAAAARAQADALAAQASGSAAQIDVARHSALAAGAALRRVDSNLAECKLAAPREGVVLTRSHEPGEVVLPGARILTLVDLSQLRTTFYLPNANLADASPGKSVEIFADAHPGKVFAGTILSVASKAEFTPRNIQTREDRERLVYAVKVAVPNPDRALLPGMPVEVRIPGTRKVP